MEESRFLTFLMTCSKYRGTDSYDFRVTSNYGPQVVMWTLQQIKESKPGGQGSTVRGPEM